MPPKKNRTPEEQRVFDAEQAEKTRLRAKIAYAKKTGKDYIRAQGNLLQLAAVRPNPVPPSAAIVAQMKPPQVVPEESESESESEEESDSDYVNNYGPWVANFKQAQKEAEEGGYNDYDWSDAWHEEARKHKKPEAVSVNKYATLISKFRTQFLAAIADVDDKWADKWLAERKLMFKDKEEDYKLVSRKLNELAETLYGDYLEKQEKDKKEVADKAAAEKAAKDKIEREATRKREEEERKENMKRMEAAAAKQHEAFKMRHPELYDAQGNFIIKEKKDSFLPDDEDLVERKLKGKEYLVNNKGYVLDFNYDWIGQYDRKTKTIDRKAPEPKELRE